MCCGDVGQESTRGGGGGDGLEITRLDVACRTNVKDVDLAVLRSCKACAPAEAAVARKNEELVIAEGVDLGLSSSAGLATGFLGGL